VPFWASARPNPVRKIPHDMSPTPTSHQRPCRNACESCRNPAHDSCMNACRINVHVVMRVRRWWNTVSPRTAIPPSESVTVEAIHEPQNVAIYERMAASALRKTTSQRLALTSKGMIYRRLGGDRPRNRFVSFVRARMWNSSSIVCGCVSLFGRG
jgi:hypothetical protein